MSSRQLQIVDAVIAKLAATPLANIGAGNVCTDPDYPWQMGDLPAVAVYLGDETVSRALIGMDDRQLTLKIKLASRSSDPPHLADQTMLDIHGRIMNDTSLGGLALDIANQAITRSRDVMEAPVLLIELDYQIDYRTTNTSLE